MAEADRVVVELLAKVDAFDQPIKQSATKFSQSMDQITASATKAEATVSRSSASRSSAVQREAAQISQFTKTLGNDMLQVGDLLASDRSPFVVPVKQGPAVTKAMSLVTTGAGLMGGALGGIALAGAVALAGALFELMTKGKGANDELDKMVEKLKEQAARAHLSEEAQRLFARTIEGSIETMRKLTEELDKQNLSLEDNIALKKAAIGAGLANVLNNIGGTSADLGKAVQEMREAQRVLDRMENGLFSGENPTASIAAASDRLVTARQRVADLTGQLRDLSGAADQGARALGMVDFPLIERNAKAAANPIGAINLKFDQAADAAKKAGTYTKEWADQNEVLRAAAVKAAQAQDGLAKSAAAAAKAAISSFKGSVIGAEGTGSNKLGSSASGFGQFMPSTFLSYFDRLFPDKKDLTESAKLSFRDVRSVAEAVIDKATDDYVKVLKSAGAGITAANLYTVHLLGAGDAKRFLQSSPNTPTSQVLSESVLRGNPFLRGTVGSAQAAIGKRIGDSSGSVSTAAVTIQRELDKLDEQMSRRLADQMEKEQEVELIKGRQVDQTDQLLKGAGTLAGIFQSGILPSLEDWEKQYDRIIAATDELNQLGSDVIDTLLNPDNWKNWGSTAKSVLHEIMTEILKLGAINPLKNLLLGQNNPTLGDLFGKLFGGGGGGGLAAVGLSTSAFSATSTLGNFNFGSLPHMAGGGSLGALPGDNNLLSINGAPRAMVGNNERLAVIPNNGSAASSFGGMQPGVVRVLVEASKYFDGRVLEVSGPVIAQASAAAANGGASISRRNLSREAMHRLD